MSGDGDESKSLDRAESYVKAKRNLLFITSATVVIFFSGGTSIKIPGLSDTDGLPKSLAMLFILIAILYFGWEFYEEFQSTKYHNHEFSFDYRGSDLEARLSAKLDEIKTTESGFQIALSGILTAREAARHIDERWSAEVQTYAEIISSEIATIEENLKRNGMEQNNALRVQNMMQIGSMIENRFAKGLPLSSGEDADAFLAAVKSHLEGQDYEAAYSRPITDYGILKDMLSRWTLSLSTRDGSRLMTYESLADDRLNGLVSLFEQSIEGTRSLDRSISKLARNIRREQVVGHRWRDGWGSVVMTCLAAALCLIEIIGGLTPDVVKEHILDRERDHPRRPVIGILDIRFILFFRFRFVDFRIF